MKRVYQVFMTETDNSVLIEVPELGILTEAKNLLDAIEMSRDAIGLKGITKEDKNENIGVSIIKYDISTATFLSAGKTFETYVDVDFEKYRKSLKELDIVNT